MGVAAEAGCRGKIQIRLLITSGIQIVRRCTTLEAGMRRLFCLSHEASPRSEPQPPKNRSEHGGAMVAG